MNSSAGEGGGFSGQASSNASGPPVLSDDQLSRLSREELVSRLRSKEGECVRLMRDRAQLMKDVNRTLQLHLAEVRGLREVNQALQKDNAELRDLSCFLDDDRLKARKIAKEWQKFGKYTSTVMRQEVTAYQMKLYELEQKQENLLRENMELKELCLYLDDDREARHNMGVDLQSSASLPRSMSGESSKPFSRSQSVVNKNGLSSIGTVVDGSGTPASERGSQARLVSASRVQLGRHHPDQLSRSTEIQNSYAVAADRPDEELVLADGELDHDVSHASSHSSSSTSAGNDSLSSYHSPHANLSRTFSGSNLSPHPQV